MENLRLNREGIDLVKWCSEMEYRSKVYGEQLSA